MEPDRREALARLAARVARVGCGRSLPRPQYNAGTAAAELKALLENNDYAEKAVEAGRIVRAENGAAAAADEIEHALRANG